MALTPKQQRFVEEYLVDLNATQAAVRAGYPARSARQVGAENLSKPDIAAAIAAERAAQSLRTRLEADDVVLRWWTLAHADPNELVELQRRACRYCYGRGNRYQRTAIELQRDRQRYETERAAWEKKHKKKDADKIDTFPPFDEKGGIGFDPRKDPSPTCQRCWGDGEERVLVKDTRRLSPAARLLYAGVKRTRDGVSVSMRDQDAALLNVAKHLGMHVEKHEHTGKDGKPIAHAATVTVRFVRPGDVKPDGDR